jgi:archaellum component FlaC
MSPSTAITGQYVTITGEGLPLPRYYSLWKNSEGIVESRDWCLVLDFGPNEQWLFENKRIRNNELDIAWVEENWYPFSFYTPDPIEFLDSPVWKGKLTSITRDFTEECNESYQFHIGSKYLKVPVLPADDYTLRVYYYDKNSQDFTNDHDAVISAQVLKDPINVDMEVGGIHFPGEAVDVTVQVDVDGIYTDGTSISLELYKGETFVQDLSFEKATTGFYVATFDCPAGEGDYLVKASVTKEYETFTLHGSAVAGFTVNPTLSSLNAALVDLEGKIATLQTDIGEMKVDIGEINGKVIGIEDDIATVQTDIGTLHVDISKINGRVVDINGTLATIETALNTLEKDVKDLDARITGVNKSTVEIHTTLGVLNTTLGKINGIAHLEQSIGVIETDLGTLTGRVKSVEDGIATIKTDIGTVVTNTDTISNKADSIKSDIGWQPLTLGLSLVAALAAIAAAALILRKVYLK